jgi:NAD-specific glutamate dehydrogenase
MPFPLSYRERFPAQAAVLDIQHAEAVLAQQQIGINLYRPIESPAMSSASSSMSPARR